MAEQALQPGEVARLAVVAGGEGAPEHARVAQVLGDVRAGAEPGAEVLGDVVGGAVAQAGVGTVAAAAEGGEYSAWAISAALSAPWLATS